MTAPYPERVKALAKAAAKRNKPYDPVPKKCPISGDSVIACVYYKAGKAGMHYYVVGTRCMERPEDPDNTNHSARRKKTRTANGSRHLPSLDRLLMSREQLRQLGCRMSQRWKWR